LAGDALLAGGHLEVTLELPLQHAVVPAGLLLLPQLDGVLRRLAPGGAVLPRRGSPLDDGALVAVALLALQVKLNALTPAQPADGTRVSRHWLLFPSSSYTRRRFGGRQPLWGIGVTSLIAVTSR